MEQITGSHLKRLRLHYKGKQKEVAEYLKIPQLELKSWEAEDFLPDDEKIRDYVKALGQDFHMSMNLMEKMDGGNIQEIYPVVAHSNPGFQTGQREPIEGVTIHSDGNNHSPFGKISFSIGSSVQISDGEWTRVTVGVELPFPLDRYEEIKDQAINKAKTVLHEELSQVVLATAEAAGKDIRSRSEDGGFSKLSESLPSFTESAPRHDGTHVAKTSGGANPEWDPAA